MSYKLLNNETFGAISNLVENTRGGETKRNIERRTIGKSINKRVRKTLKI